MRTIIRQIELGRWLWVETIAFAYAVLMAFLVVAIIFTNPKASKPRNEPRFSRTK